MEILVNKTDFKREELKRHTVIFEEELEDF